MDFSRNHLKAVPIAVAVLLGGMSPAALALPVSFGSNITLDAAYSLGGTYVPGVTPAAVIDAMPSPPASIYQTAGGADLYYFTSDALNNNAFFHTYGFSGSPTYFGARASGEGNFFATTRASFQQTFTNTSAIAQTFNFAFNVSNGDLGITGTGAGFADLLLNIKKNGTAVSRSRTTITQTAGGTTCDDSTSDLGSLAGYMSCAPGGQTANDGGGLYGVNMGLIGAGESFVLDYDIIATVSGNLSQGTQTEERCTGGYGEYGGEIATFASLVDGGGGGGGGRVCEIVTVNVPGGAIARSGDPFDAPIFDANGVLINDPGQAGLRGSFNGVPEPGSLALVGLGLAGVAAMRRKIKDRPV